VTQLVGEEITELAIASQMEQGSRSALPDLPDALEMRMG
jgi:hypothetical protein